MAALPSLKQLQYLVTLSEKLNFTRAAETCFVTQSTLSAGLKELETVLGTPLVERDRQSVLMTATGQEVAERARHILAATQDLMALAAQAAAPMCGRLRLGVIPTIAPFLLPLALPLLRQHYPELRLALREDLTANLLSRLEDGQLDFALIALPYDTGTLHVESLFEDELWLVGRKDDPQTRARTVNSSPELSDRLLLLEEGHCLRNHSLYACGPNPRLAPEAVEATSLLTLVQMIESGLGLGLVPKMAINSGLTASPALVVRPLRKPGPLRTIALAARRSTVRQGEFMALAGVLRQAGTQS
jgi:LysR family hydrogen peroxide-inducible transcriptional activator